MSRLIGIGVCVLLCSLPVFAQTETATLSGRVTDPQEAAVVGAEVVATNTDTNIANHTKTNDAGIFIFPSLQPGPYRLFVRFQGFATLIREGLLLHVQDRIEQNVSLRVGSVDERITVTAETPLVNTQDAAVSTVIDRNFVESLPLNGRSFNTLLQLTPGVVIAPTNSASEQFAIAGQRTTSNNFVIDGVSANFGVSQYLGLNGTGTGTGQAVSALGGTSSLVSVDALQEFRIETSSFAPEYGRTPGGQVVLTTRSGANAFHGGVFDYFRNDVMDANDWFANQAQISRAPERHNDFGGFLGGPIVRDNTFFFLSYEGARLRLPNVQNLQVPSLSARQSAPAALAPFLNAFSVPNGAVSADGYTAGFTGGFSTKASLDAGSVRVDHKFSDRFSVFARYNDAPSQFATPLGGAPSQFETTINTKTLTVDSNMTFSSRLLNNLRGNFSSQTSGLVYGLSSNQTYGAVPFP